MCQKATFRFVFPNWRVGLKNYLVIGSEGAAKAAANAYPLIETVKLNDGRAGRTDGHHRQTLRRGENA